MIFSDDMIKLILLDRLLNGGLDEKDRESEENI